MNDPEGQPRPWTTGAKQAASRLLALGGNRLELLTLELVEERDRLRQAAFLAVGMVLFAWLSTALLTLAVVALGWAWSPPGALLLAALFHGTISFGLYRRFQSLWRNRDTFSASLEQFRKDRDALEKLLQ